MEGRLLQIKAARASVSPSDSCAGSWWVDLHASLWHQELQVSFVFTAYESLYYSVISRA